MTIEVVNKFRHEPTKDDLYIGRGSPLGNPFSHKAGTKADVVVDSRQDAIRNYKSYILRQIESNNVGVLQQLNLIAKRELEGKHTYLVCFCSPMSCHGDVVRELVLEELQKVRR